ncbi:taurine catabolism dioxygenase [Suhomyces tanzawaensis NRRL Y-17324]|uniref:Taurine catabolism dioxygenase n=1 Tax=Suhomyces tanzawaensis NRRL Y-17324 TaxID=984487 RepID=A0A1E4SIH8_9ASCO|nr:taurine catabolism dioxygenase [Suhomyces tanzawaensis NRRL Y-17324]ODV79247.1 taurine catabolism dioxygenase [Suhomyces tanzawaensis NRRL Y-17324]
MAPTTAPVKEDEFNDVVEKLAKFKPLGFTLKRGIKIAPHKSAEDRLPPSTKARYARHNIELPDGYPVIPAADTIPKFADEAYKIRDADYAYIERAKNADPEKKALFGAAKEVKDLTKHIGTEIVGLQLADLNDKQKDELALLVAERVVVFFRDQDLSPLKQLELGDYWGQVEVHPQAARLVDGISVIWQDYFRDLGLPISFKNSQLGNSTWHTDLVHEHQPAGITHLHNDAIPSVGGDTLWASGYAAYDKLSPALQKFLDGKTAIYRSAHPYLDRENPFAGPKFIEREHPLVRTHPATGWKSLFVNRPMTVRIVGLLPAESDLILNYLYDIYEKNLDIQVRFNWQPTKEGLGTSAIWDNRISQHNAVWDHEGKEARHGTRVTSLAEVPYFDPNSKSQREALGLDLN